MKKLLLILTSLTCLLFSLSAYAAEDCKIKTWPSPKLTLYFNDVKEILGEIKKNIGDSSCGSSTWVLSQSTASITKWYDKIVWDSNWLLDYDRFLSSWDMDIYPLFNWWLPSGFYRDHDYIVAQSDLINNLSIAVAQKCATDKPIDSALINKKFEDYNLAKQSSMWEVLSELRKFNIKLSSYFRCSIAWSNSECSLEWNQILADDIKANYVDNMTNCNKEEPSFKVIEKLSKDITDSEFWFKWISKWFEDWNKSLKLLLGWSYWDFSYKDYEKNLLSKELSKQWLNSSQAEAVLKNLDCMNNKDTTIIHCVWEAISSYQAPFKAIINRLLGNDVKKAKSTNDVPRNIGNTKDYEAIINDVISDHKKLEKLMNMQNKSSDIWIANLIQLHANLLDINKKVNDKIPTVRALCNKQATWVGNCGGK